MDFSQAELAKEMSDEVLTHRSRAWARVRKSRVTPGLVTQFSVSCHTSNSFFILFLVLRSLFLVFSVREMSSAVFKLH